MTPQGGVRASRHVGRRTRSAAPACYAAFVVALNFFLGSVNANNVAMSRRQSSCFVPACTTGYKSSKQRATLFSVPKDDELFQKWQRAIPRADKDLQKNSAVCELHFDPQYISRHFEHVINGEVVKIERSRPVLTPDAVPTLFPNLPKYLSKPAPRKRKDPDSRVSQPPPKNRKTGGNEETPILGCVTEWSERPPSLDDVALPSSSWGRHVIDSAPLTVAYSTCTLDRDRNVLHSDKLVLFSQKQSELKCEVYVRGVEQSLDVTTGSPDVILKTVDSLHPCSGAGGTVEFPFLSLSSNVRTCDGFVFHLQCKGVRHEAESACLKCRYLRKLLQNQKSRRRGEKVKATLTAAQKIQKKSHIIRRLQQKLSTLTDQLKEMKSKNESLDEAILLEKLSTLPPKQKLCIMECFRAAKRKSTKGMLYDQDWVLECILMRMKSPRLYEHIRRNQILILPSRTCLKTYMKAYQSGFGFNDAIFTALAKKTKQLDPYQLHGGIIIDEMKLAEHLGVSANGKVTGFVDLGPFSQEADKHLQADHGLVVLYQPLSGSWHQILGVFASHGNVKGHLLAKLLVEAVILTERANLHVDFITCDGASWNRSMWKVFGVSGTSKDVKPSTKHPMDPRRELYFFSDFPHLVKCARNRFVDCGFKTLEGTAHIQFVKEAHKLDDDAVTLKVMPKITRAHLSPNNYEKMKVNYAFHLFGSQVLRGLQFYKDEVEQKYGSVEPTAKLIQFMHNLIMVMTARTPAAGLRPNSEGQRIIRDALAYLNAWEAQVGSMRGGFLSSSTAEGMRVTLQSTLGLLKYNTDRLGYKYLLTSRMSQDSIEKLFGIIRQFSGCNDHPTVAQFLTTVNCLSIYDLAKAPPSGNCASGTIQSLLDRKEVVQHVDTLLDSGQLDDACDALQACEASDHKYEEKRSDSRIVHYVAGYVARKCVTSTGCGTCIEVLLVPRCDANEQVASFTRYCDRGGLLYPSAVLQKFVQTLEDMFTLWFSHSELHQDSILELLACARAKLHNSVGCEEHKDFVTNHILKFYIVTRLHFFTKSLNKDKASTRDRKKYLKQRRCT